MTEELTVLDRGYQRAVGWLYYPLPLVMVYREPGMRSVYNPTKTPLLVKWYYGDELSEVREVKPYSLSAKGYGDRIYESLISEEGISYPFD